MNVTRHQVIPDIMVQPPSAKKKNYAERSNIIAKPLCGPKPSTVTKHNF